MSSWYSFLQIQTRRSSPHLAAPLWFTRHDCIHEWVRLLHARQRILRHRYRILPRRRRENLQSLLRRRRLASALFKPSPTVNRDHTRRDDAPMHDDSYVAHLSSTRVICTMPILYASSTRARTNAPRGAYSCPGRPSTSRDFRSLPRARRRRRRPARARPARGITLVAISASHHRHHARSIDRRVHCAQSTRSSRHKPTHAIRTMANPVVFFDIEIGGAPAGRIEMTVRTRCSSRAGDAIDRRAEGRRECDRIR